MHLLELVGEEVAAMLGDEGDYRSSHVFYFIMSDSLRFCVFFPGTYLLMVGTISSFPLSY